MEKFISVSASPSQEIKHVPQNQPEGFFSPLIHSHSSLDSRWSNSICVDALACSMGRLSMCASNDSCAFTDPNIQMTLLSVPHSGQLSYAQLSMNKYASNVVEHLLEFSEERDAAIIIQEIKYNHNFLGILQDPSGNYVVKRALQNCKGTLYKILSTSILFNYPHLHTHLYGKRVLAFVQRRKNCVRKHI